MWICGCVSDISHNRLDNTVVTKKTWFHFLKTIKASHLSLIQVRWLRHLVCLQIYYHRLPSSLLQTSRNWDCHKFPKYKERCLFFPHPHGQGFSHMVSTSQCEKLGKVVFLHIQEREMVWWAQSISMAQYVYSFFSNYLI